MSGFAACFLLLKTILNRADCPCRALFADHAMAAGKQACANEME